MVKLFLRPISASLCLLTACAPAYDPMQFTVSQDRLIANGVIDARALRALKSALSDSTQVSTLVLQYVPGSADDDANLELARMVRDMGLTTLVPSDGLIASGGTDLFLAGVSRVLEQGACVGVHEWSAGTYTAKDVPEDGAEHRIYLDYYEEIGIDPEFYWFTLDAASAEDIHWMTRDESLRFDMATGPTPELGSSAACDDR